MSLHYTHLNKMRVQFDAPIQYHLALENDWLPMNDLIGHKIRIAFEGVIHCTICGRKTAKSFGNGACYPCFANAPQASPCIINPELCEAHLGKGRDVEWEQNHHNQPHVVYLAKSSGVKVGVTRAAQVPNRWIDQGASEAIILAEVPYRQLAGLIEVELKAHYSDKTNWQRMLKNEVALADLQEVKEEALNHYLSEEYHEFISDNDEIFTLQFPVENYPTKVKSIRLDKVPVVEGVLTGIKGQYLYLDDNNVINIRNHSGYLVELSY